MSASEVFFDTNVLLYLLSGDRTKADRAEALIGAGGVISVQVLNEFASVASRKLGRQFAEIREILSAVRATLPPVVLRRRHRRRGHSGEMPHRLFRRHAAQPDNRERAAPK